MAKQTFTQTLDRAISAAKARVLTGAVLSAVSLGLVGYYLSYAHRELTSVTPEFLGNYATGEVLAALPTAVPEIRARLIGYAPTALDQAEARLMEVPDRFADELLTRLRAESERFTATAEEELVAAIRTGLVRMADELPEGKTDEQRLRALADGLAELYAAETSALIDRLHGIYTQLGGDVLAYLEHLARGEQLDAREALQREALVTFLTMAARAKSVSSVGP